MIFGFRLKRADGSVEFDASSFGWLYVDSFEVLAGVTVKKYPGLGAANVQILSSGTVRMSSRATVVQENIGGELQITITATYPGTFQIIVD